MMIAASPAVETERATWGTRRVWRLLVRVAIVSLLVTGLVGVLHMPFASALLRKISPRWACPVRGGTPAQIDRGHAMGAANIRAASTATAPARPALVFALDATRLADVRAWAAKNGVSCNAIGGNENLQRCADVPAPAVDLPPAWGPLEEITFEFRSSGELVNVQTMRRSLRAADAASIAASLEARAASALGPPSSVGGEPTTAHLSRSVLTTYVAVHPFHDYRAKISATNLASTGVMVREEYLSARP